MSIWGGVHENKVEAKLGLWVLLTNETLVVPFHSKGHLLSRVDIAPKDGNSGSWCRESEKILLF